MLNILFGIIKTINIITRCVLSVIVLVNLSLPCLYRSILLTMEMKTATVDLRTVPVKAQKVQKSRNNLAKGHNNPRLAIVAATQQALLL